MKKIPCLFERVFEGKGKAQLLDIVTPGCEWVLQGEGTASRKWDGTACAVIGGVLFKRYDAKNGKPAPAGGIPCQEPDAITGHWPHWVPVEFAYDMVCDPWHTQAWRERDYMPDGTYELVGPKVNGNPERIKTHVFKRHGADILDVPRTKDDIRSFLESNEIEGIVFTHPDGRMCKIRRADFGLPWGSR